MCLRKGGSRHSGGRTTIEAGGGHGWGRGGGKGGSRHSGGRTTIEGGMVHGWHRRRRAGLARRQAGGGPEERACARAGPTTGGSGSRQGSSVLKRQPGGRPASRGPPLPGPPERPTPVALTTRPHPP